MDYRLTRHAIEELSERRIPLQLVEMVLADPEQQFEEDDLMVYQSRFAGTQGKTYLLRVFVNITVAPARVVTVYKTSKLNKYWR
ncbi:DUF4258 domain-containing protein [Phormidium sp. FACHB-1136]|uniref:DUF4258 domain-containing protein n=1 Tax=Phormidium sp. FACHB-1136 TaxID=2692848 RepID=UPI001689E7B0|nr:DUF4258 domain-containing protein [Phormidium sp. FACHB-1136]MBD2425408.1 DUF4258 domain-containing protein [Phormidium sp. FACHB-1136]